jgi:hypothetical protein
MGKVPIGNPGSKELIDFQRIDYWAEGATSGVPTTKGIIHYAKDGFTSWPPARNSMREKLLLSIQ